jgi:ribosome-interacting GTPase 1
LKPRWEGSPIEPETGPDVVRPALVVANKADAPEAKETLALFREMLEEPLPLAEVSSSTGEGIDPLRRRIYDLLGIMRIYSKIPGHPADLNSPFTIHRGASLIEFAQSVHQDFMENLKFGKVWGSSKFDGMIAKRDYVLQDGDVVELHI